MTHGAHYRVKRVAELTGVTVRTLHHYDHIDLLKPSARSSAGYRLYSESDVMRLHRIVVARELGLSLEEIRQLLDDPQLDQVELLSRQRQQLITRQQKNAAMIEAIDRALHHIQNQRMKETTMTDNAIKSIFEGFDPSTHDAEVIDRWGGTEPYAESARRTKDYSQADWAQMKSERDAILTELADHMREGREPDSAQAIESAEAHRLHIDRWFYPCNQAMHAALADMYEADERFAASLDAIADGLTEYLVATIRAAGSGDATDRSKS